MGWSSHVHGECRGKSESTNLSLGILRMETDRPFESGAIQGPEYRESIEVRESARVVLGDSPQKGVVRCSLDSCLLLSSFFASSPP